MSTIPLTVSQALLKFLSNQYIAIDDIEERFVCGMFSIFGHGNVTGLGEALEYDNYGIETIRGNNEQGMAHAAIAFAKERNRLNIMPCTSSIGPGALNMVTAAGVATANRIPLLLFPGDTFIDRQPDPVLQQIERPYDHNITANDAFKPVSQYFDRITRPEVLMVAMLNAMRVLTDSAETGAVTIALPQDVQCESYDYPIHFFKKRVWRIDRVTPSDRVLEEAAALLKSAQNPLIIAGGGAHYSLASDTLSQFAKTHGVAVTTTCAGKSILPWSHEYNLGAIGTTGTRAANRLAKKADVVLCLGTRLQDFTTASKWQFQQAKIIQVNVNHFDSHKMEALSLKGDVKASLEALSQRLSHYQTSEPYRAQVNQLKSHWQEETDALYAEKIHGEKLSQVQVVGALNEHLSQDDTIICAAGSLPGDLNRLWRSQGVKDFHLEYGFSCMGYEIAAGLGVSLAKAHAKDRGQPYVLVGDGSFLMLHSELVTARQLNKKMIVVLLDNSGFQCIHNLQCANGSKGFRTELKDQYNQAIDIDFALIAQGLGIKSYKVHDLESLKDSLSRAKDEEGPVLIEAKVLEKSMSDGYESWWRVGVPKLSKSKDVSQSAIAMEEVVSSLTQY